MWNGHNYRIMTKNINTLTDFEKDILKQEIDLIDKTVTRIDHIHLSLKNWTIVIWGGSLYLVTQYLGKSIPLTLLTAIIPFLFGIIDLTWVKQLLIVGFRQGLISEFINGNNKGDHFLLLDPIGRRSHHLKGFKEATSLARIISYKGQIFFYVILILISLILGLSLQHTGTI
jgi:hypothetical protein